MRPFYRLRQFWDALSAAPTEAGLERVREFLTPALMELFLQQQPSEQAHSLHIFLQLSEQGEKSRELLAAALLHDVGKSVFPLSTWERALVVVRQTLTPQWAERWGDAEPRGWKRAFVVAKQHPAWGAQLAEQAGAPALCVRLIRHHQEKWVSPQESREVDFHEVHLLVRLQQADNES